MNNKLISFKYDDKTVIINNNIDQIKNQLYEKILQYCKEHDAFIGEKVAQSDDCIIDLPELMIDIVDNIFNFEVKYDD